MITTMKAGDVTIIAQIGSMCGSAPLHIAQFSPDDWTIGSARYNNGNPLIFQRGRQLCPFDASFDGNSRASTRGLLQMPATAWTSPRASPTPSRTRRRLHELPRGREQRQAVRHDAVSNVSHTPEQTGGFSEDELTNAVVNGTIPEGGYFDNSIICYPVWHQVHTLVGHRHDGRANGDSAYLRSLTPGAVGCFDLFNSCDGGAN